MNPRAACSGRATAFDPARRATVRTHTGLNHADLPRCPAVVHDLLWFCFRLQVFADRQERQNPRSSIRRIPQLRGGQRFHPSDRASSIPFARFRGGGRLSPYHALNPRTASKLCAGHMASSVALNLIISVGNIKGEINPLTSGLFGPDATNCPAINQAVRSRRDHRRYGATASRSGALSEITRTTAAPFSQ